MSPTCDRCKEPIVDRSEAVICTHFGALPTLSHRICASVPSPYAPDAILKIGVDTLPMLLIINLVTTICGGALYTLYGIFELFNSDFFFPIEVSMGLTVIVAGIFLHSSIRNMQERTSGLIS